MVASILIGVEVKDSDASYVRNGEGLQLGNFGPMKKVEATGSLWPVLSVRLSFLPEFH